MQAYDFRKLGKEITGLNRWQSELARRLNINVRTVQRWSANGLPDEKASSICAELGVPHLLAKHLDQFPRDEWLISRNADTSRLYITHCRWPRFVARILPIEPTSSDKPYDLSTEPVFKNDYLILCEFTWIDPKNRSNSVLQHWIGEAADEAYKAA